jgi:hypothetical protein
MASKNPPDSKKADQKKKVEIQDLSKPGQELAEWQAKAVKGGAKRNNGGKK